MQVFDNRYGYIKYHLINDHKMEAHNWMVSEIEAKFKCDECDLDFPRKSFIESHMTLVHRSDRGTNKIPDGTIEACQDQNNKINQIPLMLGNFPCDCTICGELLQDNSHSQNHMKDHFRKPSIIKPKEPLTMTHHPPTLWRRAGGITFRMNQPE